MWNLQVPGKQARSGTEDGPEASSSLESPRQGTVMTPGIHSHRPRHFCGLSSHCR